MRLQWYFVFPSFLILASIGLTTGLDVFADIVGGVDTSAKPWVASLGYSFNNGWNHYCGASVIDSQWAITAAHCISQQFILDDFLRIGTNDLSNTTQAEIYPIVECTVHPSYNKLTYENDIAVFKLGKSVKGPYIRLNDGTNFPENEQEDKVLDVIGWGVLQSNSSHVSEMLQKVDVPVVGPVRCSKAYGDRPDTQICAGYALGGKDSCFGDSGGPLYAGGDSEPVQVGIVSFGAGCAEVLAYGVYTRVSKYLSWLKEQGAQFKTPQVVKWRKDYRCGYEFPLPDGSPAQCNPESERYCCSSRGTCWRDKSSCTDPGAVNYRKPGAVPFNQTIKMWRNDYRCGASYPLPNGTKSQCNPIYTKKRYCCSVKNKCGKHCGPGSTNYLKVKWRKDGRCGYEFPLPDGSPAQCNPHSSRYCCSSGGGCWRDRHSCTDPGTVNYRKSGAVPFNTTIKPWRNDYRCGPKYLLLNGKPAECNPDIRKKRYCCSAKNVCGTKCGPGQTSPIKWRKDGRCGYEFPLHDGSPAQCNPKSGRPCCSSGGGCWRDRRSCTDPGAVDYRKPGAVPFNLTIKPWRNDYRCGPKYLLLNGKPAECNPDIRKKRYCCSAKNVCGTKCAPGSTLPTKWRKDGRCGYEFPLHDGSPAQCNPNSRRPCCSSGGGCWRDRRSCTDPGSVDYRKPGAVPFNLTIKPWRNDYRCGPKYLLLNGKPAECNPDIRKKRYCCSAKNVCGTKCAPGSTLPKWRKDGRCGYEFPLHDGSPAQCNPNSRRPCCSSGGGCWRDRRSCTDPGSVDYRKPGAVPFNETIKLWRNDYRCGPNYPLLNGDPSQCNPNRKKKRYCCFKEVCGTKC